MIFGRKFGGYVAVDVMGENREAFLNSLASTDISLWDIVSKGDVVTFCVALENLAALRRAAHQCNCEIRIRRRGGFAFVLYYLKQHRNAVFSVAFAFLLLWMSLSFVWKVEVEAEEGTTLSSAQKEELLDVAEVCGIHPLLWKSSVEPKEAAAAILGQCPDLAWVGLSVQGVTLTIHAAEKMEDRRETALYGHVVAKKDGTLRRIFVLRGQKTAEVGNHVKAGDVLISGDIVYEEEGKDPVYERTAAKGTVLASVQYEGVCRVALKQQVLVPTGKMAGILCLEGSKGNLILWGEDKDPFSHSVVKEQSISLGDWSVFFKTYQEADVRKKKISEQEACSIAEQKAGELAKEQMTEESVLLDRKVEIKTLDDGRIEVRVLLICEEEIGKFTPLP